MPHIARPEAGILGYTLRSVQSDSGHHRTFAEFSCYKCAAKLQISNQNSAPPEFLANKARQKGWLAHPTKPNMCYCSSCQGSAKIIALPMPIPPQSEEDKLMATTIAATTPALLPKRSPTDDDKRKMRHCLDRYFDDATGSYLDGMSDQRIGDELSIPWKTVADFREAAYGKLREDPVLKQLRIDIATLTNKLADLTTRVDEYEKKQRERAA